MKESSPIQKKKYKRQLTIKETINRHKYKKGLRQINRTMKGMNLKNKSKHERGRKQDLNDERG